MANHNRYNNLGGTAAEVVKAERTTVMSVLCINDNASTRYLQLHNKKTVPQAADVPVYTFLVPGSGMTIIGTDFFGPEGSLFTTGLSMAFSTTKNTYTAGTGTEATTTVHYK